MEVQPFSTAGFCWTRMHQKFPTTKSRNFRQLFSKFPHFQPKIVRPVHHTVDQFSIHAPSHVYQLHKSMYCTSWQTSPDYLLSHKNHLFNTKSHNSDKWKLFFSIPPALFFSHIPSPTVDDAYSLSTSLSTRWHTFLTSIGQSKGSSPSLHTP